MICTSLCEKDLGKLTQLLKTLEFAEIRLENLVLDQEAVKKIFSSNSCLIATNRSIGQTDELRQQVLLWAIEAGAAYVDLEIESEDSFLKPLIELAKKNNCQVIISFHDYEKTPDTDTLKEIINTAFEQGADLVKIACLAQNYKDAIRLISIMEDKRPVLSLAMGDFGRITRIAAPLLGAPFTFASIDKASATAPGQLDAETLKTLYKIINS